MRVNRIVTAVGITLSTLVLFFVWYNLKYAMDEVSTYEINSPKTEQKVLIATQGSEYKNALVDGIVDHLKTKEIFIRVTDISNLIEVDTADWNIIIILHTWEMWKAPEVVSQFIDEYYNPDKVFVLTTSGAGDEKIQGVDAITGASIMEELPDHLDILIHLLDDHLSEESGN